MSAAPLPLILAGTLGAGAMLVIQPPAAPQACEPVELVRFVSNPPEIHVVHEQAFGRSSVEWLTQFAEAEPKPVVDEDAPPRRRRRHGR